MASAIAQQEFSQYQSNGGGTAGLGFQASSPCRNCCADHSAHSILCGDGAFSIGDFWLVQAFSLYIFIHLLASNILGTSKEH